MMIVGACCTPVTIKCKPYAVPMLFLFPVGFFEVDLTRMVMALCTAPLNTIPTRVVMKVLDLNFKVLKGRSITASVSYLPDTSSLVTDQKPDRWI